MGELASLSKCINDGKHFLQFVLVGLPRLHAIVRKLVYRELIDEGYPIYGLTPLRADEAQAIINSRYSGADAHAGPPFLPESVEKVTAYSHGIPRSILTLCKLAILKANLEGHAAITPDVIDQVAHSGVCDQDIGESDPLGAGESLGGDAQAPPLPTSERSKDPEERHTTRLKRLHAILKVLQRKSPSIEASALISQDGVMIASALSSDLDEVRVGIATATLLSLGARAAVELRRGEVKEVIVRGDDGYAVIVNAGRGMLLLVLARETTKLGPILFDVREAIKRISDASQSRPSDRMREEGCVDQQFDLPEQLRDLNDKECKGPIPMNHKKRWSEFHSPDLVLDACSNLLTHLEGTKRLSLFCRREHVRQATCFVRLSEGAFALASAVGGSAIGDTVVFFVPLSPDFSCANRSHGQMRVESCDACQRRIDDDSDGDRSIT